MAIDWTSAKKQAEEGEEELKKSGFQNRTTQLYTPGVLFEQTAEKKSSSTPAATNTAAGSSTSNNAESVNRELAFARRARADTDTIKQLQEQQNAYLAQQSQNSGSDFWRDFGRGFGYGSERTAGGLLSAVEGVSDFIGSTGSKALEYITSFGFSRPNDVSEFFRQQSENYLNTSPTEQYRQSIEQRYQPTDAQRTLGSLNETVAAMLPSLGAAALTGGGSAAAQLGSSGAKLLPTGSNLGRTIMGVQAAGGGAQEAFQEGATVGEALTFGAASGALETATEALVGGIPGLGKGAASELLEKVVSNPAVRRAIDIAGEGGEEAISTIVTPYLKRAIYDTSAENATLDEIAQSAIMGMAAAGVLQAGIELPTALSNRVDITRQANANLNDPEFVQQTTQEAVDRINQDLSQQARTLPTVEAQEATTPTIPTTAPTLQTGSETVTQRRQGVQVPIETRTWQDAGNRKVNAFQYDHPELRPYYAEAARALKYDLSSAVKGERFPIYDQEGYITRYDGTKRSVTEPIPQALDNAKLSYAQIEKAIDDLIADNGQENYAAAKKLELVLDDMLTNGYTDSDGYAVPPNQEYIAARERANSGITGSEYSMSEAEWASLMAQEPEGPAMLPTFEQQYGPESSVGAARYGFDPYTNLQGKYGTLPEGEKPSRVVDVPAKTSDKSKVSLTARTVMEAAATPDSALPDIAQLVVDGRLSYMPVSNNQRTVMAESKIKSVGYSDALANWRADVRAGKSSADLVAMGAQLYNATVNAGDTKAAMDILYDYTRLIRSGAQATQAARILKTLTPAGTLYMIQKEVNNINEAQSGKKKRNVTSTDNVPVEIWMQRVGENLADDLSRRIEAPKDQVQTVAQTILSDLRRYANETAPKRLQTGKTRTEMDRIMDLFQNKAAYNEAWAAAKDTLSDTFENDPDALVAFDNWLNQSLDYTKALTKELTKQSDIVIPEDLADAYLSAETEEARAQALDAIYQSVADQVPSTWKDKWNAWRYLAMLGNPRTHIRNIVGNVGFQPVRYTKDRVAALIESGVSAASGGKLQRTKSFAYNPSLYAAAWQDFDNVSDVLSGNKYDDIQSIINDKRTIFKFKPLELARRGNSNLLSAEDMVFKRVTYADALSGYLSANGVTAEQLKAGTVDNTLLSAARNYAGQEALKSTFNDRNAVSDKVVQIARSLGTFGEAVLPFKRTPANILVRGAEYSPLGLAKGLTYDLYQVKQGNMTGAEVIDNIAAGMTGSALMALGGLLAAAGVVTGGAGDDEKQAQFNELTGGQTYALNLPGGGSVTLDWLAPEALPFFMGVQAMQSFGEEGLTADTITSAFASISEPMLEMSMLQSLNDLIDSVSYSEMKIPGLIGSALVSYLTQAIPTLGGQIERSSEETRMSTYTDKNLPLPTDVQYALGKASARIPGWDYQQIPYIDAWGRTESNGPLPLRTFNNFINPAYTSQENVTPLDEEIQRLYDATGDSSVIPNRPDKEITVSEETEKDGKKIRTSSKMLLTGTQYIQYATERGQMSYDIGSDLISNDVFKSLTPQQKTEVLDDAYAYADAVAKSNISAHDPEAWVQDAEECGVDPALAILYRYSDAKDDTKLSMLLEDDNLSKTQKNALQAFSLSQMSDAAQEKWPTAQAFGFSYEDYVKYYPICAASGAGKTKTVIIQDLVDAGMDPASVLQFWNIIRK